MKDILILNIFQHKYYSNNLKKTFSGQFKYLESLLKYEGEGKVESQLHFLKVLVEGGGNQLCLPSYQWLMRGIP